MLRSVVGICPWLASRWNKTVRYDYPTEDNACYLWEDSGVPPDVGRYCAGTLPWRGERYVPVPVEDQFAVCLTEHYGTCRWLRERRWYRRETPLVCPLLGTAGDRRHKYLNPCAENVCHAKVAETPQPAGFSKMVHSLVRGRRRGAPITAEKQKSVCLTEHYPECARYREHLQHTEATQSEEG